jgi:hypothetical protein
MIAATKKRLSSKALSHDYVQQQQLTAALEDLECRLLAAVGNSRTPRHASARPKRKTGQ